MKKKLTNDLLLYSCPVTLVTTRFNGMDNIITVSWTGIASSHPEYITISIKPERFSHSLIKNSKVFGLNIPNINLLEAVDICGNTSGRDIDKFSLCNFTKVDAQTIDVPLIKECPINIECQIEQEISLGSHELFIAKVTNKLIDKMLPSNLKDLSNTLSPINYVRPYYFENNPNSLGYYGYTKSSPKS